jgi:hypothetical protein
VPDVSKNDERVLNPREILVPSPVGSTVAGIRELFEELAIIRDSFAVNFVERARD